MLNYDEIVTRAETHRDLLLTNAKQQRLAQSLVASQPHRVSAWLGRQLIRWGQQLQGETLLPPLPGAPVTMRCVLVLLCVLTLGVGSLQPALAATPGGVVVWGNNGYGQLNLPAGLGGVTAIAGGRFHSLALKSDGTVVAWGCGSDGGQCSVPAGLGGVTAIAGGDVQSLALKRDGTVVAWGCGNRDFGQCSVPAGLGGVTAIAANFAHSLALKSDGTVVAWGCGDGKDLGQCSVPAGLSGVTAIAGGRYHSLALKSDGTVVAWGCGSGANHSPCNVPTGLGDVTVIAGGDFHSLALKSDGTVVAWGCVGVGSEYGQCSVPVGLSGVAAIAAGFYHSLALKSDGTVVAWGCDNTREDYGQCSVSAGLNGVTAIAAGFYHNLVLVSDTTAPVAQPSPSPAANANGWNNSDVAVTWNWTDSSTDSGYASDLDPEHCPTSSTASDEGTLTLTATCRDRVGNQGSASYTVKIDKTAPVVAVTGVSSDASYPLDSVPAVGCSTNDLGSGVATAATLTLTGGNADGTGSFTATCSGATDKAGNSGSASVTYSVIYPWSGFLQPVDNLPTVNTGNAGQGIPVKFSLGGDFGLNIFASGFPASQNVSCGSGGSGSTAPIEETATAGNSNLQYDPTTQSYTYVWKTEKAWAGTCRQLIVRLIDGVDHVALFQFNGKRRSAEEGEQAIHIFLPLIHQ